MSILPGYFLFRYALRPALTWSASEQLDILRRYDDLRPGRAFSVGPAVLLEFACYRDLLAFHEVRQDAAMPVFNVEKTRFVYPFLALLDATIARDRKADGTSLALSFRVFCKSANNENNVLIL
jgi:hypothetical protein